MAKANERCLFVTLLVLLVFQPLNAQWVQTNGPRGGLVNALAASGNAVFAGTVYGGIYRSVDNGMTWSAVNSGLRINTISFIYAGDNAVFAGDGSGIYRFIEGENRWTPVDSGLNREHPGTTVLSMAASGGTVFAGTSGNGVLFSTDNGKTWNDVRVPMTGSNLTGFLSSNVYCFAASGGGVFAGTGCGVFRSVDRGEHWIKADSGLPAENVNAFAVMGDTVFAGTSGGVFVTTDNGEYWRPANSGITNKNVQALAVKGGTLFAGTATGIFRSNDRGTGWTAADSGLPTPYDIVMSLAVSGGTVFAGLNGGGIFCSADNAESWTPASSGIKNSLVQAVESCGNTLIVGTLGGGIFVSADAGAHWVAVGLGPGGYSVLSLAVHENRAFAGTSMSGIFVSADCGLNWTPVNSVPQHSFVEVHSLLVTGGTVFAGCLNNVFISTDNGSGWTAASSGLPFGGVVALAASGSNIVAGTVFGGVYLSTNGGNLWAAVDSALFAQTMRPGNAFAVTGSTVLAVALTGKGVFRSDDYGVHWAFADSSDRNYYWINAFAASGGSIFAGTDEGRILLSTDNGTRWTAIDSGLNPILPKPPVKAFAVSGGTMFAGTYGCGVWKRPLAEMVGVTGRKDRRETSRQSLFEIDVVYGAGSVTAVKLIVPRPDRVTVAVCDPAGRAVSTLVNGHVDAGTYRFLWNTAAVPQGCYVIRVRTGADIRTRLVHVLR